MSDPCSLLATNILESVRLWLESLLHGWGCAQVWVRIKSKGLGGQTNAECSACTHGKGYSYVLLTSSWKPFGKLLLVHNFKKNHGGRGDGFTGRAVCIKQKKSLHWDDALCGAWHGKKQHQGRPGMRASMRNVSFCWPQHFQQVRVQYTLWIQNKVTLQEQKALQGSVPHLSTKHWFCSLQKLLNQCRLAGPCDSFSAIY